MGRRSSASPAGTAQERGVRNGEGERSANGKNNADTKDDRVAPTYVRARRAPGSPNVCAVAHRWRTAPCSCGGRGLRDGYGAPFDRRRTKGAGGPAEGRRPGRVGPRRRSVLLQGLHKGRGVRESSANRNWTRRSRTINLRRRTHALTQRTWVSRNAGAPAAGGVLLRGSGRAGRARERRGVASGGRAGQRVGGERTHWALWLWGLQGRRGRGRGRGGGLLGVLCLLSATTATTW
jgi:hypothetical protein